MLKLSFSQTKSSRFPMVFASLAAVLAVSWASPSYAQDKEEEAPAEEAAPQTPEEKKAAAIVLFGEGQALAKESSFEAAILKFEEAFVLLPDPNLQFMIGESYQRDGTENRDFDKIRKSITAYQKYVELVPEGEGTDKANERIGQLEESVKAEEDRISRVASEEEQAKLDAELAKKAEEEEAEKERKKKSTMQLVFDAGAFAGVDQQVSGILRMAGGGLLSWEHFALEAHLGFDGLLRISPDQGTSARSLTLIDLGVRYGLNYKYVGPFVSAGASFGIFTGKPSDRKLKNDSGSCDGGTCSFNVDKNIVGRLGLGYGFEASDKSTVAFRLDVQAWTFSVDDEQGVGFRFAGDVEKPQTSIAILAGLEFMRWL